MTRTGWRKAKTKTRLVRQSHPAVIPRGIIAEFIGQPPQDILHWNTSGRLDDQGNDVSVS